MTDDQLVRYCEDRGIRVRALSSYYHLNVPQEDEHCLVINYAGLNQEHLEQVLDRWAGLPD